MSRIVRTVTRVTLCERVNVHEPLCTPVSGRIQESVSFAWSTGTRGGAVHSRSTFLLNFASISLSLSLSSFPLFFVSEFLSFFVPCKNRSKNSVYTVSSYTDHPPVSVKTIICFRRVSSHEDWTYVVESYVDG